MRAIAMLLVSLLLALAACGKYGPPVRRSPARAAAEAPTSAGEPAGNTQDEELEKTQ
jgi:predicted small lipoprotein YifL